MPRYVVLARDFDFNEMARRAVNDEGPKHILGDVCSALDAVPIMPSVCRRPSAAWRALFRVASGVYSTPQVWSIAHEVARRVRKGDLVYATGEDVGLTVCVLTLLRGKRPHLAVSVIWPERVAPTRLLLAFKRRIGMLLAVTENKAQQVRDIGGQGCPPVVVMPSVIDLTFFSCAPRPERARPLIASGGLVDRDYVTLAAAVVDLQVDVEVCAMASMPTASAAFPAHVPDNMVIGQQSIRELRDMYRAAQLTVVPLTKQNQGSGLTVVWEAMASGCPVIATQSTGDLNDYIANGLVVGVPAEDPLALRHAILDCLSRPDDMSAMAVRARAFVAEHFNDRRYVDVLTRNLLSIQTGAAPNSVLERKANAADEALPVV